MKINKIFLAMMILCLALSALAVPIYAETKTAPNTSTITTGNIASYEGDDGTHKIYWTEGIEPPKMTNDPTLQGTGDYFEKHVEGSYISYGYPMQDGKGYYDLNKNDTTIHCYLASSSNIIHWWLEQNKASVTKYISYLRSGDVYADTKGLRPLTGAYFNEGMWTRILTKPTLSVNNIKNIDRYMQPLYEDALVTTALSAYLQRTHDGYWPDFVWDYFFNGYTAINGENPDPNTEATFNPDHTGGYFYPIFAHQKLTRRYNNTQYSFFNENLGRLLAEGKGVNLSYVGASNAHAITIWGAEYNAEGNLERIFYTDSDDYDVLTNDKPIPTAYGMYSYNVHEAPNGQMYLSNNTDPNAKPGAFVLGMYTLDLMKDEFAARVNDLTDPMEPEYAEAPASASYAVGSKANAIKVTLSPSDTGYFTYQWYESPDGVEKGDPIIGKNSTTYVPDTSSESVRYYYVEVTNYKNGKVGVFRSPVACITVSQDITDAAAPIVVSNFAQGRKQIKQYTYQNAISVTATSPDNGTLSYQWYMEKSQSANLSPVGGTPIPGATEPFIVPDTSDGELYMRTKYYCIVTNTNTDVNGKTSNTKASNVISYEITALRNLNNAMSPIITRDLVGGTYNTHDDIILSLTAGVNDGGTLTYEWYRGNSLSDIGTRIEGATASTYTVPNDKASNYYYYCVITNTNSAAVGNTSSTTESNHVLITVNGTLSEDNTLSSLAIQGHDIEPVFHPDVLYYTLTVAYDVNTIDIIAIANDSTAIVKGTGSKTLSEGANNYDIVVTSASGGERTYHITITRESQPVEPPIPPVPTPSDDNSLSSLTVGGNSIVLEDGSLTYDITVENSVSSVKVVALANNNKATVIGNGNKNLIVGKNTFTIEVKAENGVSRLYTINVTRKAEDIPATPIVPIPSGDNSLSSLTVSGNSIVLEDGILTYDITVENSISSVKVVALANHAKATVIGNGNKNLFVGKNTFTIEVKAENGVSKLYTINVTRKAKAVPPTPVEPDTPETPEVKPDTKPETPEVQPDTKPETPEVQPDTKPEVPDNEEDIPSDNRALTIGLGVGIPCGIVIIALIVVIIIKKRRI